MNIQIPDKYLELATDYGLPTGLAIEVFMAKKQKKGITHLMLAAVDSGHFPDEYEAGQAIRALWTNYQKTEYTPVVPVVHMLEPVTHLERARKLLEKQVGEFKYPAYNPLVRKDAERHAIISDLHEPFVNEEAFQKVLRDPADTLWILGDILDSYQASRHIKNLPHLTLKDEISLARARMEIFSQHFRTINVIQGNHDVSIIKRCKELMPAHSFLMQSPVQVICAGLNNVRIRRLEIQDTADATIYGENVKLDYATVDGDVFFGHFDNFCGADAATQLVKWVSDWRDVLGLETEPRVFIQAHVHRLGLQYLPNGKQAITSGTLAKNMIYQFDNHGKYTPATTGYVVLYRKNGVTDTSRTELVYLGK